ncbi:phosphate ABC transporter permease PstA [Hippea maritima]|uniref:Phosphate transport system permease protein PstA n=1 Tax=Hippea maritima (strain ATCC 700847 / DSM 10411 / MH2) TaxID=760142 RepID=F2LVS4_HIPMA|nr:phosphate ABC transporter permease PstA [Hippea maritima]AEA33858.1 phosphate ABC transporter, inner membrane subunit PstA [Hippea maritima DSM 10411]
MNHLKKRKIINLIAISVSIFTAFLGIFWLVFIIASVLIKGLSALNLSLFINDPAPPGIPGGGLRCAFVGQAIITVIAVVIGVPAGILGGTYLAEYGKDKRISSLISTLADMMMSFPSIVVGVFVYTIIVRPMGHFSGFAGSIALAIIMISIIVRTTEETLRLIPWEMREAAFALGAPYYLVIKDVVYRGALKGLFTGVLLSIARVSVETAPLLFTSFNNSFLTLNPNQPMSSLTVTIYQYAMGPYPSWHRLAWGASFVIVVFILIFNLLGRWVISRRYDL